MSRWTSDLVGTIDLTLKLDASAVWIMFSVIVAWVTTALTGGYGLSAGNKWAN